MTTIDLSGANLAPAWLAVAKASSDSDAMPTLYRTVCVDVFEDGVRLSASTGYLWASAWVPRVDLADDVTHTEPLDDATPEWSVVARDIDKRVLGLMSFVRKQCAAFKKKNGEDDADMTVRISQSTSEDPLRPTLGDELDVKHLLIEVPDAERLVVDTIQNEFPRPNWAATRVVDVDDVPHTITSARVSATILSRLAKIPALASADGLLFETNGENQMAWSTLGSLRDFPPYGWFTLRQPATATPADDNDDNDDDDDESVTDADGVTQDPINLADQPAGDDDGELGGL